MKVTTIVFTKSKKNLPLGSWAIRLWTGKPYSHVARKIVLYGDVELYYQANESKVNYECKDVFNRKHEVVLEYKLEISDLEYREISRACVSESGRKYGILQNIGIVLVDIMGFFGFLIKNPWKDGRNCSELIYMKVFKRLFSDLDLDPNKVKPHQIEEIIKDKYSLCSDGVWRSN